MKNLIIGLIVLAVGILLFGFSNGSIYPAFIGGVMILAGLLLTVIGIVQVLAGKIKKISAKD